MNNTWTNYCFDYCPYNQGKKHIETPKEQYNYGMATKLISNSKSKLCCALGYKQSAKTKLSAQNILRNNGQLCSALRKYFSL